ncbi:MAG: cytochrome c oxidase subunit I [Chitinophagaceae bacterium]|nr:cytochrome c oxidase subunit I [Chitinophagaceae bacterium]
MPQSQPHTPPAFVLPFYGYAALSLLVALGLLWWSVPNLDGHYFQPKILGIVHLMALGWGSMMILGASHQLLPVLLGKTLYSNKLAMSSFVLAAIGIPMLVMRFMQFQFDGLALTGAGFIILAIVAFFINVIKNMQQQPRRAVHVWFILAATIWLLLTMLLGWLLLYNFSHPILPNSSLHYLSLHAHIGLSGWFLLLIMGVGSRLIPMFLISQINDNKTLWYIFILMNASLLAFTCIFLCGVSRIFIAIPFTGILTSMILFARYVRHAYQQRVRYSIDAPMKLSLVSVLLILLPSLLLAAVLLLQTTASTDVMTTLVKLYGFLLFFGWLSTLIIGMTFKTLPFIVWSQHYSKAATTHQQINPADLVQHRTVKNMMLLYATGLVLFAISLAAQTMWLLHMAAAILLLAGVVYTWLVFQLIAHQPAK